MVTLNQLAVLLIGYGLGLITAAYTLVPDITAMLGFVFIAGAGLYIIIADPWWRTINE